MSTVGYATLQIIPSLRGMQGKLAAELDIDQPAEKAGASAGGKLSGALGKVLKGAVVSVGAAAGGALGTALFKGWSRLTAIENATAKLTGLGNSAASVKSIMDNALASVKGTAFGLDEAASVSAMAVAAGIKPGKQLEGVLKTVADTATIAGASMSDMGMIFGSVAARGKLQGDDLMQLQARGVPVLQFLAKHYGVTAQAASDMVSKGKVDFANFNAAMAENLGGAALKSGETTKGAFANMGAAAGRFGASLLQGVFPVTKQVFGGVTKFLDDATAKMTPFVEAFSTWITTRVVPAAESLLGKVGQLGDKVKAFFDSAAGQQLKTDTMDKLGSIFANLSTAAKDLAPAVGEIAGSLGKASGAIGVSTWELLLTTVDALAKVANSVLVPAIKALADWMSKHQTTVTVLAGVYTGYRLAVVATTVATTALTAAQKLQAAGGLVAWLKKVTLETKLVTTAQKGAAAAQTIWAAAVNGAKYAQIAGYLAAVKVQTVAVTVAQKVAAAATKVWAGIQAAFNFVMAMNPIGLIVIGIAALVAGIVIAYKKSDTFRAIVDAAFRAVGQAAMWLWNNAIKPLWDGIKTAFDFIAGIITSWWTNVVSPVFSTVMQIITSLGALWWWLAKQVVGAAVDAIKAYLSTMADAYLWLWNNAVKPAIDAIAAAAMWLWRNAIVPAFNGIKAAVNAVGAAAVWLWQNAIVPAFNAISSAATWLWRNVLVPAFDGITSAAKWLWSNGIQPAFNAIGGVFSWLWSTASSNFDRVMSVVGRVGDTFRSVFGAIGGFISNAFNGAVGTVRSAINSLISLVNKAVGFINGNVIDKLNKVPGVDFPHVPTIPSLADGGIIPATPGGRIVRVAEAGQAEAVVPLDRLQAMLRGRGGDDRPPVTQNFYTQQMDERAVAMMSARRLAAVGVR